MPHPSAASDNTNPVHGTHTGAVKPSLRPRRLMTISAALIALKTTSNTVEVSSASAAIGSVTASTITMPTHSTVASSGVPNRGWAL